MSKVYVWFDVESQNKLDWLDLILNKFEAVYRIHNRIWKNQELSNNNNNNKIAIGRR